MKHIAFTLAEVLITLAIIGVVAALTIPNLVQHYRAKELETGLRKAYSTLNQVLNMYQAENGFRLTPENTEYRELKKHMLKYLKVAKDCAYGQNENEACIKSDELKNIYHNYIGVPLGASNMFDDGQALLNDNMYILIENHTNQNAGGLCISVDVNGVNKKPNQLGKDLFMFQIDTKGTLLPMGAKGTSFYRADNSLCSSINADGMNGAGCTFKALYDKNFWKDI